MKVEILEERLSDLDEDTGKHYSQVQGDVITVPDKLGEYWLSHGWAKDVDGVVPTGERKVEGATIQPHKSMIAAADSNPKRGGNNG